MNDSLRRFVRRAWPLAFVCIGTVRADPDPVASVEKAASEWVKARAENSRLETEWSEQQRLLASLVDGFTERAATLEARRDYLRAKTAEDRGAIADLAASNKATAANLENAGTTLKAMGVRLLELRPSLPPRLSAALDLPYRSLAAPDLSLGERMQLTMTVLNRCTQFNRTITCDEELLTLQSGGNAQLLDVIYWGLGHGYALDRPANKAWFGSPGPQGWTWEPLPDGSAAVAKLIAVAQGKVEPAFVVVPARLADKPETSKTQTP